MQLILFSNHFVDFYHLYLIRDFNLSFLFNLLLFSEPKLFTFIVFKVFEAGQTYFIQYRFSSFLKGIIDFIDCLGHLKIQKTSL